MSEYYLADLKAEERARQRDMQKKEQPESAKQEMKVTLLGDFLYANSEPQGFDPYNNVQGRTARDVWSNRRDRR